MKFRIFNVAALAMLAASILTSCGGNSEEPQGPGKDPAKAPFVVTLSDITATSVYLGVVPDNAKDLYLSYYLTEKEYVEFGSKTGTQKYVDAVIEQYKQMDASYTTAQIISSIAIQGENGGTFQYLDPKTSFYATVVGVNTKGQITTDPVHTPFTTLAESGQQPTATMTLAAGLDDGTSLSKYATATVTISDNCMYGMGMLLPKSEFDKILAAGMSHIDALYGGGAQLSPSAISGMIAGNYKLMFERLDPKSTYTVALMFISDGGKFIEVHGDVVTGAIGTAPEFKPETVVINAAAKIGFGNRMLSGVTLR